MEEERAERTGPRLRQTLGREHAEGEAGVHHLGGHPIDRPDSALDDLAEADLLGVANPSSKVSKVRPSNRSGVCTVSPARRSSSAKATMPGVSPCAWWKSTTSVIPTLLFLEYAERMIQNPRMVQGCRAISELQNRRHHRGEHGGPVGGVRHPLRKTVLDLVVELAEAGNRAKSTVARHVGVLVDADLMHVARTRRMRGVEERHYGRTGRAIYMSVRRRPGTPVRINGLSLAAPESIPAHGADDLRTTLRHARIPRERVAEF
jgi:hypothetical protein